MKYYLPSEVVVHNTPGDIWVSALGKVYNVTQVVKGKKDPMVKVLIANAGKDLDHLFDGESMDIKRQVQADTGMKVNYTAQGMVPQMAPVGPTGAVRASQTKEGAVPWWKNTRYELGPLSKNPRPVRVVNTLLKPPHRSSLIWVAGEETVNDILNRMKIFNSNTGAYTVKYCGNPLHPDKTLDQNGIVDERDKFTGVGLPDDSYIPALVLYYNDDLI